MANMHEIRIYQVLGLSLAHWIAAFCEQGMHKSLPTLSTCLCRHSILVLNSYDPSFTIYIFQVSIHSFIHTISSRMYHSPTAFLQIQNPLSLTYEMTLSFSPQGVCENLPIIYLPNLYSLWLLLLCRTYPLILGWIHF